MPLTQREKDQIAQQAIEQAESQRSIQESLRPANLTVAGLRNRIAHAEVERNSCLSRADYHLRRANEWTDELIALHAELRTRPGKDQ